MLMKAPGNQWVGISGLTAKGLIMMTEIEISSYGIDA